MSAARTALLGLVDALAEAVEPAGVTVDDDASGALTTGPEPGGHGVPGGDGEPGERRQSGVRVRASALSRVGRSRRDGAVLDLELVATVGSTGPQALELMEQMLTALELSSRYTVEPASGDLLGFRVRVPVAVRLDEPVRWRVSEPLRLEVQIARSMPGVVLDAAGQGVPDARVSAPAGERGAVTDADGRFRLLVADAPRQDLVVEVRGATRTVEAATDTAPVVIRWE